MPTPANPVANITEAFLQGPLFRVFGGSPSAVPTLAAGARTDAVGTTGPIAESFVSPLHGERESDERGEVLSA